MKLLCFTLYDGNNVWINPESVNGVSPTKDNEHEEANTFIILFSAGIEVREKMDEVIKRLQGGD